MALNWTLSLTDSSGSPTSGSVINAATLTAIRDIINNEVRCSAYHNTTQSINDSTWTACSLNAEDYDTGSMHSTVTNNSRITVPSSHAGLYSIKAQIAFATNSTGFRGLAIYVNGSPIATQQIQPIAVSLTIGHITVDWNLSVSDYVEAYAYQSSGGALNVGNAARQIGTHLQVTKIR